MMIVGALASALSPGFLFLVMARFVLDLGTGGDYPVSAVLMSEYANRKDRGRLVGLVFSMQDLGLIVGPLVALVLLSSGMSGNLTWRILLALGAIPAAAVVYLRAKMPESPRFQSRVQGRTKQAAAQLQVFAEGAIDATHSHDEGTRRMGLSQFLSDRRMLKLLLGTAGAWFLFDYAYYGNTLSLPSILKEVSPHASLEAKLVWTLGIFVVFALPGYILAVAKMDRIGHRRLQLIGFAVMALCFAALGAVPALTASVGPFLAIFGLSYFFIEFGPNHLRVALGGVPGQHAHHRTRHRSRDRKAGSIHRGVLGPPTAKEHEPERNARRGGSRRLLGLLLTLVLPEPARRTLEDVSGEDDQDTQVQPIDPTLPSLEPSAIPDAPTA